MLQGIINTILGIWLMAAPSLMYYAKSEANIMVIFGALIATFATISIAESVRNVRWMNVIFGLCVAVSPLFIGFENKTVWLNCIFTGSAVAGLSLVKGKIGDRFGGGWSALFRSDSEHKREAEEIPGEIN